MTNPTAWNAACRRRSKRDANSCLLGMYVSAFFLLWRDYIIVVLLASIFITIFFIRLSYFEWTRLKQHISEAAVVVGALDLALSVSPLFRTWYDVLSYQPLLLCALCHLSWILSKRNEPYDGVTRGTIGMDARVPYTASTTTTRQPPPTPIEIPRSAMSSPDMGSMGVGVGSPPTAPGYSDSPQHIPRRPASEYRYPCEMAVTAMTSAAWHRIPEEEGGEAEDILGGLTPTMGMDWEPAVKDIVLEGRDESELPRDRHRHW